MAYIPFAARVAEASTSQGIGPFVLASAMATYGRFSSIPGIAIGDTLPYYIASDPAGVDAGAWEHGIATYSAANTLTRTTVVANSAGTTAPINFGAGTKTVIFGEPGHARQIMAADALAVPSAADKMSLWNSITGKLNSLSLAVLASFIGTAQQSLTNKTLQNPAYSTTILADASAANGQAINWNADNGQTALLTTTDQASRTVANPTNLKVGAPYTLIITQGVANQVITAWGSVFDVLGDYTLAPAIGATTVFWFVYDGQKLRGGITARTGGISSNAPAPTPAPTPAPASAVFKIQAEDATRAGTLAVNTENYYAWEGTGYVGWFYDASDVLTFTTPAIATAGSYTLTVRLMSQGAQQNFLSINGGANILLDTPDTGVSFIDFNIIVALAVGANTLAFKKSYGSIGIDYISAILTSAAPPPPPPAPTPAPPAGYVAPLIPFGSRPQGAMPYAAAKPSKTNAAMDGELQGLYDQWKAARVKKTPTFTAQHGIYAGQSITDAYHVDSDSIYVVPRTYDPVTQTYTDAGVKALTVSEGMGYGMLLCVMFAGYDVQAKTIFDGMLRLARGRPAYNMTYFTPGGYGDNFGGGTGDPSTYLMDWKLKLDTSYAGGGEAAADGDMDMALALLMADKQWGSAGTFNYLQQAKNTIAALKKCAFSGPLAPVGRRGLMYVGNQNDLSRTSDYMPTHFRAFEAATGDTFWQDARINSYNTIAQAITQLDAAAGLPPGFIRNPLAASAANFVFTPLGTYHYESVLTGVMDGNAMRCPWRYGHEHVWYGDSGGTTPWGTLASNMVATIKATSNNDVNQLGYGYSTQTIAWQGVNYVPGQSLENKSYYDPGVAAMTAVGGMCNATHQAWVDQVWNRIVGPNGFNTTYFVGEPTLLSMLILSGNWWKV